MATIKIGPNVSSDISPNLSRLETNFSMTRTITILMLGVALVTPRISRANVVQEPVMVAPQSGFASGASPAVGLTPVQGKKFSMADFAWLSGRWQGQWGPRIVEQVWTPAKAGMMLGVYRVIENDKTLVIEFLALTELPDGIEYSIRHFTPALAPWEKSGPTVLNLVTMDTKRIVFENPIDGQPKHAILDRVDEDTYVSRSEIVPLQGDAQVVEITFHRQKITPKKP
jgi:hypothetical protein